MTSSSVIATNKVWIGVYTLSLISTRSRYGLRLLIELAENQGKGPLDLGTIARRQDIPEKYLAKLVQPLKSAGLLRSARGARGGYELARSPLDIDLLTVVEVLEGQSSLLECTSSPESCERQPQCPSHPVWMGLERAIRDYLGSLRLADAARSGAPEYSI